jgi:hypothetical protein
MVTPLVPYVQPSCLASEIRLYVVATCNYYCVSGFFVLSFFLKMSPTLISSEGSVYTNASLAVCLSVCLSLYIQQSWNVAHIVVMLWCNLMGEYQRFGEIYCLHFQAVCSSYALELIYHNTVSLFFTYLTPYTLFRLQSIGTQLIWSFTYQSAFFPQKIEDKCWAA